MSPTKKSKSKKEKDDTERRSTKHKKKDHDEEQPRDVDARKRRRIDGDQSEKQQQRPSSPFSGEGPHVGSGNEISLSIDETNKLRAQLGMKPLETDKGPIEPEEGAEDDGEFRFKASDDGKVYVHKPADNWGINKQAEQIREKLAAHKERRKVLEKLNRLKGLSELEEGETDSALSWVEKSRLAEEERKKAEERAKLLEQMDEEFGIGTLVEKAESKRKATAYTSKQLGGMQIEHAKESFLEGSETILVLKDRSVLDEGEDALINPTIVDEEKWKKNAELRKNKPQYNPYDNEEIDEFGELKKKSLLSKYDEEIEGGKAEKFRLSAQGTADVSKEKRLAEIREQLKNSAITLDSNLLQLAGEYYTPEEMEKFKKPKKKIRKVLRKKELKADDLLETEANADFDFGSRARGKGRRKVEYEDEGQSQGQGEDSKEKSTSKSSVKMEIDDGDEEEGGTQGINNDSDEDLSNFLIEDDEPLAELHAVLDRTRKERLVKGPEQRLAELINAVEETKSSKMNENEKQGVTLDSIQEYCKGLGDIPTYGQAGNRDDDEIAQKDENDDENNEEKMDEENSGPEDENEFEDMGGWHEAEFKQPKRRTEDISSDSENGADGGESEAILDEEPNVQHSMVEALRLAVQKGYLEKVKTELTGPGKYADLAAKRFSIVDKQFSDIDDKYAKKLEQMGMRGATREFEEKKNYKPDFKLDYMDETGRRMTPKEAFAYISWKFHGKKPGKKKMEKIRKRQFEEEMYMEMSTTDTPLNTLHKQVQKQRQLQQPYLVLSGSGAREIGTSIKKD